MIGCVKGADGTMHKVEAYVPDPTFGDIVVLACDRGAIAVRCDRKHIENVPTTCLWCAGERLR